MALHPSVPVRLGASRRAMLFAATLSMALALLLMAFALPAQAQPVPKEHTKLDITLTAAADVNPDDQKRAAPILVRVYELKSGNTFENADYFSLHNNDKTLLGDDLLVRDEFILRPGDVRTIDRRSYPDATAIGVLAGYRDLPNANWRFVHKLPPAPEASWWRAAIPANKAKLNIRLEAQGIRLAPIE